jgi:hypothetical protein
LRPGGCATAFTEKTRHYYLPSLLARINCCLVESRAFAFLVNGQDWVTLKDISSFRILPSLGTVEPQRSDIGSLAILLNSGTAFVRPSAARPLARLD